jgi:hypothetical protein
MLRKYAQRDEIHCHRKSKEKPRVTVPGQEKSRAFTQNQHWSGNDARYGDERDP